MMKGRTGGIRFRLLFGRRRRGRLTLRTRASEGPGMMRRRRTDEEGRRRDATGGSKGAGRGGGGGEQIKALTCCGMTRCGDRGMIRLGSPFFGVFLGERSKGFAMST